jgi:hypothetical protein
VHGRLAAAHAGGRRAARILEREPADADPGAVERLEILAPSAPERLVAPPPRRKVLGRVVERDQVLHVVLSFVS